MNNTAQSFNAQKKPLFWPILWIFLFYPVGITWTFLRLHKNSKITGKTLGRNIFFTLIAFTTLSMIFGAFVGNDTNNEILLASKNTGTQVANQNNINQIKLPVIEKKFIFTIESYYDAYENAANELKKSSLRNNRKNMLSNLIENNPKSWIGKIEDMGTTGQGNAYLSITLLHSNITFSTNNNEFSEALSSHTLIPLSSSLFKKISDLKKGDIVEFSGTFFTSHQDYLKEQSITEDGSMTEPDFLFRFTKVEIANNLEKPNYISKFTLNNNSPGIDQNKSTWNQKSTSTENLIEAQSPKITASTNNQYSASANLRSNAEKQSPIKLSHKHNADQTIYNATTTKRHFKTGDCTKYVTKTFIGGKIQKIAGRACLEADGSWHIEY